MVPFNKIRDYCNSVGINALATMSIPDELNPSGLDAMLADGIGDMNFMRDYRDLRLHPIEFAPFAKSILAVSMAYQPRLSEDQQLKRARYAAGKDYHKILRRKLATISALLNAYSEQPYQSRAVVDSAPALERSLASMAGLGWLGKNALIITPARGSFQFLAFLFTEAELEIVAGADAKDRCGKCLNCIVACPTNAITGRRVISERCISYLTIEHKGVIPRQLAEKFDGWWFGCDICQEVCPWNRFAPEAEDVKLTGTDEEKRLVALAPEEFDQYFAGRAIRRISFEQFQRNLLIACWSVGRTDLWKPLIKRQTALLTAQIQELGAST